MDKTSNIAILSIVASLGLLLLPVGCASSRPATFATPEAAVQALVASVGDEARAKEVLGEEGLDLLRSGDEVADREDARAFQELALRKIDFEDAGENEKVALLGDEDWPLPIPLVRDGDRWLFDVEAGREELLARRVGRNELLTLATLHAYVEAQWEYVAEGRDGNPPAFARKIVSDPGKHDGLYWPVGEGEHESPLGPLVAAAEFEGYHRSDDGPIAYHGYRYRILEGQGPSAPGGERSYLDERGLMTRGFAAVAWPAKYGNSGIMTFLVNERGIVFEKDLGPGTADEVLRIERFDPDPTWRPTGD